MGLVLLKWRESIILLTVHLSTSDGQTSSPASPFMAGGDMAVGTVCDVTWPSARHSTWHGRRHGMRHGMAVGAGTRNGSSNSFSINRLGSHHFSLLSKSSSSVCTRT